MADGLPPRGELGTRLLRALVVLGAAVGIAVLLPATQETATENARIIAVGGGIAFLDVLLDRLDIHPVRTNGSTGRELAWGGLAGATAWALFANYPEATGHGMIGFAVLEFLHELVSILEALAKR